MLQSVVSFIHIFRFKCEMKMSKFPRSATNPSPGEREFLLFIDFSFIHRIVACSQDVHLKWANSMQLFAQASQVMKFNLIELATQWKPINMIQLDVKCINIVNKGMKRKGTLRSKRCYSRIFAPFQAQHFHEWNGFYCAETVWQIDFDCIFVFDCNVQWLFIEKFTRNNAGHWCTALFHRKTYLLHVAQCHHLFRYRFQQIIDRMAEIIRQIDCFLFDFIHRFTSFYVYFCNAFIHWYIFYPIVFFRLLFIQLFQKKTFLFFDAGTKIAENRMANMLKKNYRTMEQLQSNKINAAAIVTVVVGSFYNFHSTTMDYLCKLIESNKNTNIVNRCLPLNYREIFFLNRIRVRFESRTKRKMRNSEESIAFYTSHLPFFDIFFRLFVYLFLFCLLPHPTAFFMLPLSLLFLTFQCSFLSLDIDNETNNISPCQHGFKYVVPFEIPFFVTVDFILVFMLAAVILRTIFVDKCDMLTRLTLNWIQVRNRALLFEWLRRRIIMAHFRVWH